MRRENSPLLCGLLSCQAGLCAIDSHSVVLSDAKRRRGGGWWGRVGWRGVGGGGWLGVRNRLGEPITTQRWRKNTTVRGGGGVGWGGGRLQQRRLPGLCAPPGGTRAPHCRPLPNLQMFPLQSIDCEMPSCPWNCKRSRGEMLEIDILIQGWKGNLTSISLASHPKEDETPHRCVSLLREQLFQTTDLTQSSSLFSQKPDLNVLVVGFNRETICIAGPEQGSLFCLTGSLPSPGNCRRPDSWKRVKTNRDVGRHDCSSGEHCCVTTADQTPHSKHLFQKAGVTYNRQKEDG